MKFLDPRIDVAFKKIFGSEDTKDILISFLESLMGLEGEKRIKDITILDPYLLPKIKSLKTTILDVRCTDHRGVSYIVEMQVSKIRSFLKRIQYNAAKTYVHQISSGSDYPKLNQVIAVTITDFTLFEEFEHYLSCHINTEKETGQHILSEIIYYFIELSKFGKSLNQLSGTLEKWVYFLKKAGGLEEIPYEFQEEPFTHAFEKARIMNMSGEEFELYEKAGIAITDAEGAIILAREEGLETGRNEAVKETAKNMLKIGIDIQLICQATGLTEEEVRQL